MTKVWRGEREIKISLAAKSPQLSLLHPHEEAKDCLGSRKKKLHSQFLQDGSILRKKGWYIFLLSSKSYIHHLEKTYHDIQEVPISPAGSYSSLSQVCQICSRTASSCSALPSLVWCCPSFLLPHCFHPGGGLGGGGHGIIQDRSR